MAAATRDEKAQKRVSDDNAERAREPQRTRGQTSVAAAGDITKSCTLSLSFAGKGPDVRGLSKL